MNVDSNTKPQTEMLVETPFKILYSDDYLLSYDEKKSLKIFNEKKINNKYIFCSNPNLDPFNDKEKRMDLSNFSYHFSIYEDYIQEYNIEEIPELKNRKKFMEKTNQKNICQKMNVLLPNYFLIFHFLKDDIFLIKDTLEDKFPLIIKKSFDYSGLNFQVCFDFNQLSEFIENLKRNKPISFYDDIEENHIFVIESFIEGNEYIVDFMIHPTQGPILVGYWKYMINKRNEGKTYALDGCISIPNKDFPNDIFESFKKVIKETNLSYGFAHCEYRICKRTNKAVLLDMNLRMPTADIGKLYLNFYGDLFLNTIIDCITNKSVEENVFSGFDMTYIVYKPTINNFIFSKEDKRKIGSVFINPKELIQEEIKKAEIVDLYSLVGSIFNPVKHDVWIDSLVYMSLFKTELNAEDSEKYVNETIVPTLNKYIMLDYFE